MKSTYYLVKVRLLGNETYEFTANTIDIIVKHLNEKLSEYTIFRNELVTRNIVVNWLCRGIKAPKWHYITIEKRLRKNIF